MQRVVGSAAGPDLPPQAAGKRQTSVAFWGICDIKYDPRLPPNDRVRVLELGDGRSSKFSHHGRAIKEKFDEDYCMDPTPIKRAVMTENKKFTHDIFCMEGFKHLRPPTAAYERRYHPDLARRIIGDLNVGDGAVVLKLCNRSRGAGIVVVTAAELDEVLKMLLTPPLGEAAKSLLADRSSKALALSQERSDHMEEQRLHWWSNECPVFIVESCCYSIPVEMEANSGEKFDGTMRVAYALYRPRTSNRYAHETKLVDFEIDWLGAYWKLPKAPVRETRGGSVDVLHESIVSSFNSVEKRTALVLPEHEQEVYNALTPALPRIFSTGSISVQTIMNSYREDTLFRAFALTRAGAALRATEMAKARNLFDLAKRCLPAKHFTADASNLPEICVLSYIERNLGVCFAMEGKWDKAAPLWRTSLEHFALNATSYYLMGCYQQEKGLYDDAMQSNLTSVALDPDFRSPYLALAQAQMLKRSFEGAIEAASICLQRHPDAPLASFIIGQCIYHLAQEDPSRAERPGGREREEKAAKALDYAKLRMPEQWREVDEGMLGYFMADKAKRARMPKQELHVWPVYGWRP